MQQPPRTEQTPESASLSAQASQRRIAISFVASGNRCAAASAADFGAGDQPFGLLLRALRSGGTEGTHPSMSPCFRRIAPPQNPLDHHPLDHPSLRRIA